MEIESTALDDSSQFDSDQQDSSRATPPFDASNGVAADFPYLRGDIRHLVPKLGLREYWYPALRAGELGARRPKSVRLLGTDICFFRGRGGQVVAVDDVCPHRGARLSAGRCNFLGTITCPYHGWTFDESGRNVAVLGEGPDSKICGKPGTEARIYPTQEHKGVVFIWMGHSPPAPIEEDIPEEFFRDDLHVSTHVEQWPVKWWLAIENSLDSHVPYLHMNAIVHLIRGEFQSFGALGQTPIWVGNGLSGDLTVGPGRAYFPSVGANWPSTRFRELAVRPFAWYLKRPKPGRVITWNEKWDIGLRLPGIFRSGGAVFDHYSRQCVPIDEDLTRVWYFHSAPAKNRWQRLYHTLKYVTFIRWIMDKQFSSQDASPLVGIRTDAPEMLSVTDAGVVQWRRLVVTKHLGGRNAKFWFEGRSLVGGEGLANEHPDVLADAESPE